VKILRRVAFALLCIGILIAFDLKWNAKHYTLGTFILHREEIMAYDLHQALIGLSSGLGMLVWCFAFNKKEGILVRIGWFLAGIGILLALDVHEVD
jgi:hypothetical protein